MIPAGCMISGTILTLVPTHELHFDGGRVASLPMSPARLAYFGYGGIRLKWVHLQHL